MKCMKKFLVLLIFLAVLGCADKDEQQGNKGLEDRQALNDESGQEDRVKVSEVEDCFESGELVALVSNNSFSYILYRGVQIGFEYELLQMFCDDHNLKLRIKVVKDAAHILDSLKVGYGHVAASNFAVTSERLKHIDFSNPFFRTHQVLVQRKPEGWRKMKLDDIKKSLIQDPLDLQGKKVVVKKNSSFADRIRHFSHENGLNIIIRDADVIETTEDLIELVDKGEIDYTIVDENTMDFYRSFYSDLDFNTAVSFNQNIAWALHKKNTKLADVLNKWIKENKNGKRFNMLNNKYFKLSSSDRKRINKAWKTKVGVISEYDDLIKKYASQNKLNWIWMAALIYQESKFDKKSRSWVGARGLTQMMPRTAREMGVRNANDLYKPETSVRVGIKYYKQMYDFWLPIMGDSTQAHYFSLASYNAGKGHVLDARRLAQKYDYDENVWEGNVEKMMLAKSNPAYYNDPVAKFGYCVGKEPVQYVKNIKEYHDLFLQYITQKSK